MNNETKAILERLREPMPYRWRVQNTNKDRTKAQCAVYVSARDVQARLDEVCLWSVTYDIVGDVVKARLTVQVEDQFLVREDFSERIDAEKGSNMYAQAYKSAASEAFKRAAVGYGVARFLYDIPMKTVNLKDGKWPIDEQGNSIYDLTEYLNRPEKKATYNKTSGQTASAKVDAPAKQAATPELVDKIVALYKSGSVSEADQIAKNHTLTPAQRNILIAARPKTTAE